MVKFRVKPRKEIVNPACATELAALLSCFATHADLRATAQCAEVARSLHMCMAERPKIQQGRKHASSINYLLSKVSGGRK